MPWYWQGWQKYAPYSAGWEVSLGKVGASNQGCLVSVLDHSSSGWGPWLSATG